MISQRILKAIQASDTFKQGQLNNEQKRQKAIEQLGTKWLLHPSNFVQRKVK